MSHSTWHKEEGGQAVVLIAITFLALLMAVGLAIDAGQLYVARRTMQEAADAAAYAGAVVRYQGGSVSSARLAAYADAARNGYPVGGAFNVYVHAPPDTGLYAGDDRYVEVIINGSVRTSLVPAQSALTYVNVRGVAGAEPLNNGYAIIALDRGNTEAAFYADNRAYIHLTGGGILVNSTNDRGAWSDQCSAADFTISPPYGTDVAGTGYGCFPATGDGLDNDAVQQPDPLSSYDRPSPLGMTTYTSIPSAIPATINPGVYDVEIGGAGGTTIYLNPGIYILKHGINASGNADLVSNAGGVFIFNTYTNYPAAFRAGIDTCGPINLSGNAVSSISAMTAAYVATLYLPPPAPAPLESRYINFLVYQDPNCTNTMQIAGNGIFSGTGTIYLPNAQFMFDGNNATLTGSQLIAKTVNIQSGNITIDFDQSNTAQPILPRLSE